MIMARRSSGQKLSSAAAPIMPPIWALPPYYNDSSELLIRHLPESFDLPAVSAFLGSFGGTNIRYFGTTGRLKNIAIADFATPGKAVLVLRKLHQTRLGKRRSIVEFASEIIKRHHPLHETVTSSQFSSTSTSKNIQPPSLIPPAYECKFQELNQISASTKINFPLSSQLRYNYPPASPEILTNIMYAMASDSRLYIQVLHLMNKLNLPPPFGPLSKTPKIFLGYTVFTSKEGGSVPESIDSSSESGSEIDSPSNSPKSGDMLRIKRKSENGVRKRRKICLIPTVEGTETNKQPSQITEDVFGIRDLCRKHPLQIIPPSALPADKTDIDMFSDDQLRIEPEIMVDSGGFGKFSAKAVEISSAATENSEFISKKQLESNRISEQEMASSPAFKNYSTGSPSAKLYIKNVAKTVEEENLRYIFGRYTNWESPREVESFQIRLMQEGRMRGQAFVILPSQIKAAEALNDVNGYILEGKPLSVVSPAFLPVCILHPVGFPPGSVSHVQRKRKSKWSGITRNGTLKAKIHFRFAGKTQTTEERLEPVAEFLCEP